MPFFNRDEHDAAVKHISDRLEAAYPGKFVKVERGYRTVIEHRDHPGITVDAAHKNSSTWRPSCVLVDWNLGYYDAKYTTKKSKWKTSLEQDFDPAKVMARIVEGANVKIEIAKKLADEAKLKKRQDGAIAKTRDELVKRAGAFLGAVKAESRYSGSTVEVLLSNGIEVTFHIDGVGGISVKEVEYPIDGKHLENIGQALNVLNGLNSFPTKFGA